MITPLRLVSDGSYSEQFYKLKSGTIFRMGDKWLIKIQPVVTDVGNSVNAVDLIAYEALRVRDTEEVHPYSNPQLWLNDRHQQP